MYCASKYLEIHIWAVIINSFVFMNIMVLGYAIGLSILFRLQDFRRRLPAACAALDSTPLYLVQPPWMHAQAALPDPFRLCQVWRTN